MDGCIFRLTDIAHRHSLTHTRTHRLYTHTHTHTQALAHSCTHTHTRSFMHSLNALTHTLAVKNKVHAFFSDLCKSAYQLQLFLELLGGGAQTKLLKACSMFVSFPEGTSQPQRTKRQLTDPKSAQLVQPLSLRVYFPHIGEF